MRFKYTAESSPVHRETWPKSRADEVLRLSYLGYWTIPVWGTRPDMSCACRLGRQCPKPGKHTYGRRAMCLKTPEEVGAFWIEHPESNYGILHGVHQHPDWVSVCLDFDVYKDAQVISNFVAKYGPLDWRFFHYSASGGVHLFFRVPKTLFLPWIDGAGEGRLQVFQRAHGVENVDLLYGSGKNAYSIGPGSVKPNKARTEFQFYWSDAEHALGPVTELPLLPQPVVVAVQRYLKLRAEKDKVVSDSPRPTQPGDVNGISVETRYALAGDWVLQGNRTQSISGHGGKKVMYDAVRVLTWGFGLDPATAEPLISRWNAMWALPQWSEPEFRNAAETAWRESGVGDDAREIAFMLASPNWMKRAQAQQAVASTHRVFEKKKRRRKKYRVRDLTAWALQELLKGQLRSSRLKLFPERTRGKVLKNLKAWATSRGMRLVRSRAGRQNIWTLVPAS